MKRLGLRHSATILASLLMSGLIYGAGDGILRSSGVGSGPLTPEQIKAAEKRTRKAKRLAKESSDGTK